MTLLLALSARAAAATPVSSPASSERQQGKKSSFVEYAIGRLNRQNVDFGAALDRRRTLLAQRSILNPYFWMLLASTGLAAVAVLIVFHQRNEALRRELVVAAVLARYHNSWLDARRHAEEAITRYERMLSTLNQARDAVTQDQSRAGPEEPNPECAKLSAATEMFLSSSYRAARGTASSAEDGDAAGTNRRKREAKPDFAGQIGALQEQLNQSLERERALQKRITKIALAAPAVQKKGTEAREQ